MLRTTKVLAPKYARTMASEKQLRMKIASTTNIAKITSSMKMVAAAKMRGDEARLAAGRAFGAIFHRVFTPPADFEPKEDAAEPHGPNKTLVRPIRLDVRLCFHLSMTQRLLNWHVDLTLLCTPSFSLLVFSCW